MGFALAKCLIRGQDLAQENGVKGNTAYIDPLRYRSKD